MKEIICLTGVIGSGKDYKASEYSHKGYQKLSFADGVREVSWMTLNWTPNSSGEYETFKNMKLTLKMNSINYSEITGRNYLVNIGDGLRNKINPLIWINMVESKIDNSTNTKFVISDCRYPNEITYFKDKYNLKIIFSNFKSKRYSIMDNDSEWMAIQLLNLGYTDNQIVPIEVIENLEKKFNEKNS